MFLTQTSLVFSRRPQTHPGCLRSLLMIVQSPQFQVTLMIQSPFCPICFFYAQSLGCPLGYSKRKTPSLDVDGDKCDTAQISFGSDGLRSTCLCFPLTTLVSSLPVSFISLDTISLPLVLSSRKKSLWPLINNSTISKRCGTKSVDTNSVQTKIVKEQKLQTAKRGL